MTDDYDPSVNPGIVVHDANAKTITGAGRTSPARWDIPVELSLPTEALEGFRRSVDSFTQQVLEGENRALDDAIQTLMALGWPVARLRACYHYDENRRVTLQVDERDVFEVVTECPQDGDPRVVVRHRWIEPPAPPV